MASPVGVSKAFRSVGRMAGGIFTRSDPVQTEYSSRSSFHTSAVMSNTTRSGSDRRSSSRSSGRPSPTRSSKVDAPTRYSSCPVDGLVSRRTLLRDVTEASGRVTPTPLECSRSATFFRCSSWTTADTASKRGRPKMPGSSRAARRLLASSCDRAASPSDGFCSWAHSVEGTAPTRTGASVLLAAEAARPYSMPWKLRKFGPSQEFRKGSGLGAGADGKQQIIANAAAARKAFHQGPTGVALTR
mmetsp:Transcript_33319/g.72748  ORF Transcript_33319/g.72748 Transcript_33319/m.72748 type:complete len:244 (-) Transcript_33319:708-1439(-)